MNPYDWMTILATWVTLQDCVDQQVIVNEKEKFLEAWTWSEIQILTKRCGYVKSMGSQKELLS